MTTAEDMIARATSLHGAGRLAEAESLYLRAIDAAPDNAVTWSNFGLALFALNRVDEAEDACRRAVALAPGYAGAWVNLGVILHGQGRRGEAVEACRRALAAEPGRADALRNLCLILLEMGRASEAQAAAVEGVARSDSPESRSLFCHCLLSAPAADAIADAAPLLARAISEAWSDPDSLLAVAGRLFEAGPGSIDMGLLEAMLTVAPVQGAALERWLTALRAEFLAEAMLPGGGVARLGLACALARQCFLNGYVFYLEPNEANQVQRLRQSAGAALATGAPPPETWIAALACYAPLGGLPGAQALEERWGSHPALAALIRQQVTEPREERRLMDGIPRLTAISDPISRAVRDQYEEHPYPRWAMASAPGYVGSLDHYLAERFPLGAAPRTRQPQTILIAGCGTGHHAIQRARMFPEAKILAIDLSLASLAYARRKAAELGLEDRLSFAQADIMEFGGSGLEFDAIEAFGVLHHLADPWAGWESLLAILKPGGVMLLGLYSRLARQDVEEVRGMIRAGGYASSDVGIRRFRRALRAAPTSPSAISVASRSDFQSMSGCRDLLFHVQEHRLNLDDIADFVEARGLAVIGLEGVAHARGAYQTRFPDDPAATDLRRWARLERENPRLFGSMVQFWVRKT